MKKIILIPLYRILFVLIIIFFFGINLAFDIPNYDWFVTDNAGVLNTDQRDKLENLISNFEKKTNTEIAVLTIKNIGNEDISMLAVDIWQKWWVGKKWQDNWIMMLILIEDKKRFIAVWYWLEWIITDAIAKRIWENNFPDYFRQSKYYIWINNALIDIMKYIEKDPETVNNYSEVNLNFDTIQGSSYENVLIIFFVVSYIIWTIINLSDLSFWKKTVWVVTWTWILWLITMFFAIPIVFWLVVCLIWVAVWALLWLNIFALIWMFGGWWSWWWWWWWGSFWWWGFGWGGSGGSW